MFGYIDKIKRNLVYSDTFPLIPRASLYKQVCLYT